MDLSWCIICDRHSVDNNLYCSESCRFQDNAGHQHDTKSISNTSASDNGMFKSPSLVSLPASPILTPFLYSFQHSQDRRRSTSSTANSVNKATYTNYQYFPYQFTPGSPSESSLFADDT